MNRAETPILPVPSPSPWTYRFLLVLLYVVSTVVSSLWSIQRYREFESGWAWDLAHVNQSFWALTHNLNRITVRPLNHYAREGPEPWRSVHLAPLRAVLLPAYALWPRPETLLIGHCCIFWLSIFGVARLARGADRTGAEPRRLLSVAAALAWVVTPAAMLFAINDCRPLQLGVPFLFWAVTGYIERRPLWFTAAALAALASRQEYGIAIAMLCLLAADRPENTATKWNWRVASLTIGLGWFAGYFLYLDQFFGSDSVVFYFIVPSSFARTGWEDILGGLVVTGGSLAVLTGGWCILTLLAPRYLLASLPLVVMIVQRNLTQLLPGDADWHMIRYAAIPVTLWVAGAAAALGRTSVSRWATRWNERSFAEKCLLGGFVALVGWIGPTVWIQWRLAAISSVVAVADRQPLRDWIAKIPASAAVWTDYPYSAMLSGRALLYSIENPPSLTDVEVDHPPAEVWAVGRSARIGRESKFGQALRRDGFEEVFHGEKVDILRHVSDPPSIRRSAEHGIR